MENQNLEDKEFADAIAALATGGAPAAETPAVATTETPAETPAAPAVPETKEPESTQPKTEEEPVEKKAPVAEEDPKAKKEPETVPEKADEDPEVPEQPKLYAGRFKTPEELEKGYENLQREFSKKAQQAKEAVETFTTPGEFEMRIAAAIDKVAVEKVEHAVGAINNPEHLKEATAAIAMYKRTGDIVHIEKARGFLDRTTDRRLDREMFNAAAEIKQDFLSKRTEIEMEPIKEQLMEMHKEDPDWVMDKDNQSIMDLAISLNPRVDLREIKKMIQDLGTRAVEKYKAGEAAKIAKEAAKKPNVSLDGGARTPPPPAPKSEDEMTTAEYLESQYKKLTK